MKSNNQGITLISMVVTIIVLIILAGVSLNFLFGHNGILIKATEARTNFVLSSNEEESKIKGLADQMDTFSREE